MKKRTLYFYDGVFWVIFLGVLPLSSAQNKIKEKDYEGSLADTTFQRILDQKTELVPESGFQDVFLNSKGSAVISAANTGFRPDQLEYYVLDPGQIEITKEKDGNVRVKPGKDVKSASTKILVYPLIYVDKKPIRDQDRLLKVFRVYVSTADLVSLLFNLRSLIGNVEGLEFRIVGDQIVLDGQILLAREMKRVLAVLQKLKASYKGEGGFPVMNLMEMSPIANQILAEKMEEEISGGKDRERSIKVRVLNDRFVLEGTAEKVADREAANQVCLSYLPEKYMMTPPAGESGEKIEAPKVDKLAPNCIVRIRIRPGAPQRPDEMLSVRADFVVLNRDYMKSFNFTWAPGITADSGVQYSSDTGKFLSTFTGTIKSLFPSLNMAATHGYARILKSATIMVRDGVDSTKAGGSAPPTAEFNETFTFYVPTTQVVNGVSTTSNQPVNAVTNLSVVAKTVSGSDKIQMDITAKQDEVKSTTPSPAIVSNNVKTSVVLGDAESAAIAGLITERRSVSYEREPAGTAGTTYLMKVGRTQTFTDEKGQLIIFVTPTRLRSPSDGTIQLKRKFKLRK